MNMKRMKKGIYIVVLLAAFFLPAAAQPVKNFDDLCKKYKDVEGVFTCKINGFGCFVASLFVGGEENGVCDLIRHCSSCRILVCEDAKHLPVEVDAFIEHNELEELLSISENGENIKIYAREEQKVVRQFLVMIKEGQEQIWLHIKGKFSRKMILELMKTVV